MAGRSKSRASTRGEKAHARGGPEGGREGPKPGSLAVGRGELRSGDDAQSDSNFVQDYTTVSPGETLVIESTGIPPSPKIPYIPVYQKTTIDGKIIGQHVDADGNSLTNGPDEITHYKGTDMRMVGRNSEGKVIEHHRKESTARRVQAWASAGYTKNDIAVALNIRPGLVEQHYGKELRHGKELMGMEVTEHIISRVKESDKMAVFYAKSQMGWRDGDSAKPVDTATLNLHIHV